MRNRARIEIILAGVVVAVGQACGQEPAPEVPLRGDRFDPVRSVIDETIRSHNIVSLAIAVAKDGEIVWEEAFGWADREEKRQATPHSIYAQASITKSFTATGLMLLVERGLVGLDDPVNDYLGDSGLISHVGDPAEATVRLVLQHAAGLPTHANVFFANEASAPPDRDESIRRYGFIADEPGREFVYSNFGYGILGRVISEVSGTSYAEFMKAEVFRPLGLTHTSVFVDGANKEHAVRHYDAARRVVPGLDFDHPGASAIHSSVHDLIRYGMFHLGDEIPGQERILSDSAIAMMQAASEFTMRDEALPVSLGLGWAVIDLDGTRMVNVTGGMPGTVTRLALVPSEDAAVAIMMNSGIVETYSPWDIELQAFAALIPGFPAEPVIDGDQRDAESLHEDLEGEWRGSIRTHEGELEAGLSIGDDRSLRLEIEGRSYGPIRVENPLGAARFRDGVLEGPFFGSIPTADASRSRHVLFLRLRLRGDTLKGVVSAVAMNRTFWLPYWTELRRQK